MADAGTSAMLRRSEIASALDWDLVKPDLFRIYILENKTLTVTMSEIEEIHGLTAGFVERNSIRVMADTSYFRQDRWKAKLQQWDFVKNVSTEDWQWMYSKRRELDFQGIKAEFYCRHTKVTDGMLNDFRKRGNGTVSLAAGA
jgi:Clr5 domain